MAQTCGSPGACLGVETCVAVDDSCDEGTNTCNDGCPNDSDGDGVCDPDDICAGSDDNADADGDGVPDGCDVEECDGLDNDGDGATDEDLGTTTCGLGVCDHTIDNCGVGGVPQVCDPLEGASTEACTNGLDDDCNGFTDAGDAFCTGEQISADLIDDVQALIDDGVLPEGVGDALNNKLVEIIVKIENAPPLKPACNQLKAFINQVEALENNGTLSEAQRDALQASATAAGTNAGCKGSPF